MTLPPSAVVHTKSGPVSGSRYFADTDKTVDAFLGIPYAQPPIGQLRFKKPQPVTPWTETLIARTHPRRGLQVEWKIIDEPQAEQSEDMLYLNVFTPAWKSPKEGFPVMVFIHGGGFTAGDIGSYGDEGIAKRLVLKGVIVVLVQYRIGYLGFWSTGDSACPGNLGLWDQTAGLQWVQDNIGAFHGDKGTVTVFGQSAGGVSVDLLLLSPHSNGLFHKAIMMAGTAECSWAIDNKNTIANCRTKAEELGVAGDDVSSQEVIEKLREVPASDLVCGFVVGKGPLVSPVLDGDFFPGTVAEMRARAPQKPILAGVTAQEGTFFVLGATPTVEQIRGVMALTLPADVRNKEKVVSNILQEFHHLDEADKDSVMRTFVEVFGDHCMNVGDYLLVLETLKSDWRTPFFHYKFDYCNMNTFGKFGSMMAIKEATHGSELTFLFGKTLFNPSHEYTDDDLRMLDMFTTAFTNFAKYGDPNGFPGEPSELPQKWDTTPLENPQRHFVFDLQPKMEKKLFGGRLAKYAEVLGRN